MVPASQNGSVLIRKDKENCEITLPVFDSVRVRVVPGPDIPDDLHVRYLKK